jgi:hypothetical protein
MSEVSASEKEIKALAALEKRKTWKDYKEGKQDVL